jgi:selT/selW/selH-like putative selenoprotein
LVESGGGAFEVSIDGEQVFSKLASGRFPAYQEICELLGP